MKPGGQEIYVGPLGRHSFHLIKYFEVRLPSLINTLKVLFPFYLLFINFDTIASLFSRKSKELLK